MSSFWCTTTIMRSRTFLWWCRASRNDIEWALRMRAIPFVSVLESVIAESVLFPTPRTTVSSLDSSYFSFHFSYYIFVRLDARFSTFFPSSFHVSYLIARVAFASSFSQHCRLVLQLFSIVAFSTGWGLFLVSGVPLQDNKHVGRAILQTGLEWWGKGHEWKYGKGGRSGIIGRFECVYTKKRGWGYSSLVL